MFDIKVMRLRTASNQPHSVESSHSALQHHPRQLWRFGSWYEQHQHQGARPWHSRQGLLWSWGLPILQGQCSTCLGILQLSSLTSFLHVLRHLKMNWMKDLYHTPYQSKLVDNLRWHGSAVQVDCEGRAMDTDTGSCESLTNDAVRCQACRGTCGRKNDFSDQDQRCPAMPCRERWHIDGFIIRTLSDNIVKITLIAHDTI